MAPTFPLRVVRLAEELDRKALTCLQGSGVVFASIGPETPTD
jgi:hypothetical protein